MKKLLITLTAAAAIVSAAFCIHRQVALCNDPLFANVEALTDGEGVVTIPCVKAVSVCIFLTQDANGNLFYSTVTGFRHV